MKNIIELLSDGGLQGLKSYFDFPVTSSETIDTLQKIANLFEFRCQPLPCVISPEFTFDIGSPQINRQLYLAVVDTKMSADFLHFATKKLGYSATATNTGACLIIERQFKSSFSQQINKPVFSYEASIISVRIDDLGNLSSYLITSSGIHSILIEQGADKRNENKYRKVFEKYILDPNNLIRGFNNSVIAWNGNEWGVIDYKTGMGNYYIKNKCTNLNNLFDNNELVSAIELGTFRNEPNVAKSLSIGILDPYSNYTDNKSRVVIPAPRNFCDRFSFQNSMIMMTEPSVYQTVSGGSGTGSGTSNQPYEPATGMGACGQTYSTRDACYSCCDTQGSAVLAAGLALTTGISVAVLPTAPTLLGLVAFVTLVVVGVVGSAAAGYMTAEACKSTCNVPVASRSGNGATRGQDGEYIT